MKKYTRAQINEIISANPKAVERGIVRLWKLQTADEQAIGDTTHHNSRGFSSYAARTGSYYAKWVLSGRSLTGKHLQKARKIVLKHSRQLTDIANGKEVA